MMTAMLGVDHATSAIIAFLHRPSTSSIVILAMLIAIGWALHAWGEFSTRARPVPSGPAQRPDDLADGSIEPPAVIGLLTNGYDTPRSAITATVLDLASRGWVRLSTVDDEVVVVTRSSAASGDTLRPFEQQVLNHLTSRAFNDVTSVTTLAASRSRLDRRWFLRFRRAVAASSAERGLTNNRYSAVELVPPGAIALIGLIVSWRAARNGTEEALADSWLPRLAWLAVVVVTAVLAWRTLARYVGASQKPTELGAQRHAAWMGYRQRLRERIPGHASVLAPPPQQLALAQACVMGVAEQVLDELPVAPEDHRAAWSEAGGIPHVITVRYPVRPGYGQHPLKVAGVGVVLFLGFRWLQGFFERVHDGESLQSLLDRIPGQVDLVETVAEVLAIVCWLPIVWAVWAVVAGVIDSIATRERIGSVVRARRPVDVLPSSVVTVVKPFAERDRFSTYIAVDDGRRAWVSAWLASERTAAPQGAQARVRATPILGYVRASEPVGTATRRES
jgi:hypothetical protein